MSTTNSGGKRSSVVDVLANPEKFLPGQKLPGLWKAWCRSGKDPNLHDPKRRGRIKVFIPRVHPEDVPDEDLPWAEACFDDGGGRDYGDFHVPDYNDTVWVMFEGGDRRFPVWMGTWWGMPGGETEIVREAIDETETQLREKVQRYPKRRVIKSRYGHVIEIGDDEGELEIVVSSKNGNKLVVRDSPSTVEGGKVVRSMGVRLEDQKGNYLHLDPDQNLFSIYFKGDMVQTIEGDYLLEVKKKEDGTGGNRTVYVEGESTEKTK